MNFNPNYMNYPYYQNNIQGMNPYIQNQTQGLPQLQGQQTALNGKIVENKDILNITEVPIGGYGIFPKADLSEIYVKTWNPNLKQMDVLTYQLTTPEAIVTEEDPSILILEKMKLLEEKFDKWAATAFSQNLAVQEEKPQPAPVKKEVNVNAY